MKNLLKTGITISSAAAALLMGSVELKSNAKNTEVERSFSELTQQILALPQAYAQDSDETLLQTIRLFYRLGMGMTQAEYNVIKADVPKVVNVTGADGFVGKLDTLRKTVSNSILANNTNITECTQVPTTGQFTDGAMTVKFGAPKHKAPVGYPHGGGSTYGKRLEISHVSGTKTTTSVFEFNCNVAASMLAYSYVDTADSGSNHKIGFFYDGEDFNDKHFQVFFDWPTEDVHMAIIMEIEKDLFRSWVSSGKDSGDEGFRMAAIGHLDTGKVSFFADDTTDGQGADPNDTNVVTARAPNQGVPYQACANSFDHDYKGLTSNSLCGSDTLSVFPPASIGLGLSDLATSTVHDDVESGIDDLLL